MSKGPESTKGKTAGSENVIFAIKILDVEPFLVVMRIGMYFWLSMLRGCGICYCIFEVKKQ